MIKNDYILIMNDLSAAEGVFTTAQAIRMGITRKALSQAVASNRAERIAHGAYRLTGTQSNLIDELTAIWKLTNPSAFSYERMFERTWDGIAIGGTTAANLLQIGDFHLSPYRIYTTQRINSRLEPVNFTIRPITENEIIWLEGLPVTCIERTLVDLCLDYEDPSLIKNAFDSALEKGADIYRIRTIVDSVANRKGAKSATKVIVDLLTALEAE